MADDADELALELEETADEFGKVLRPIARAFLRAFCAIGNITAAAKLSKVSRDIHYVWMTREPNYRECFEKARDMACDRLEIEAWRRAVTGVDEPVFQQGKQVGIIKRFSDKLLQDLLAAHNPHKYGRKHIEHTGKDGKALPAPETHIHMTITNMTNDELSLSRSFLARGAANLGGEEKPQANASGS